ncbi:MAG: hypothetical protein F4Z66_02435 [Gammaproteobacteria bacterium]|nr:hypothetical protein [Gammaproteobacteria bacterium]
MRLPRNFGLLILGALVGGILVATVLFSVQWLFPGDKTVTTKQITSNTGRIEQLGHADQFGNGDTIRNGDYSKLVSEAWDFEGTIALYQALSRVDQED